MKYKVGQEVMRLHPDCEYYLQKVTIIEIRNPASPTSSEGVMLVRPKDGNDFVAEGIYLADEEEYFQYMLDGGSGYKNAYKRMANEETR